MCKRYGNDKGFFLNIYYIIIITIIIIFRTGWINTRMTPSLIIYNFFIWINLLFDSVGSHSLLQPPKRIYSRLAHRYIFCSTASLFLIAERIRGNMSFELWTRRIARTGLRRLGMPGKSYFYICILLKNL